MYRLLITFILFINVSFVYAQYDFNENCKKAYLNIINLKFDDGERLIKNEKITNPSNNIPYYLENYIDFLRIIISEEQSTISKLKPNENLRLKRLEKGDKKSPYYRYCLSEIYLQWAFSRIKFREYFTAMFEINKAYRLLEKNQYEFPDFIPNLKSLGLLHALIGTIPDNYKWITKIAGIEGTIKQGVEELTTVLDTENKYKSYSYLKEESLFLLSFIDLNLQSSKKQAVQLINIYEKPKFKKLVNSNPLLCYSFSNILLHTGHNDQAINILLSSPSGDEYFHFYYLYYLIGICKLNRLDDDANKYFVNYVSNFNGMNYIKSAYQKLAWYYLINGDKQKYREYISKVLKYGNSVIDADKQAVIEAKKSQVPNVHLLKARLLFDGSYYQKALNELENHKSKVLLRNRKDSLEYVYRLGRIYHEYGKVKKAIPFYEKTIKEGANLSYYFAANAALKLGTIYENKSDYYKAKYYYNKCLSLKFKEYKNSIRQEAKAGLNRIKYH